MEIHGSQQMKIVLEQVDQMEWEIQISTKCPNSRISLMPSTKLKEDQLTHYQVHQAWTTHWISNPNSKTRWHYSNKDSNKIWEVKVWEVRFKVLHPDRATSIAHSQQWITLSLKSGLQLTTLAEMLSTRK